MVSNDHGIGQQDIRGKVVGQPVVYDRMFIGIECDQQYRTICIDVVEMNEL